MNESFFVRALFYFFLIHASTFSFAKSASALGNETDCLALLSFKDGISDDPNRVFSSWNHSLHFCMWVGVTCSRRHPQRVTALNLTGQSLVGSLSPHIGNLSFLRMINLSYNNFDGQIPQEIGHLIRLEYLNLSTNSFSGDIPKNLTHCVQLKILNLYRNKLVGNIPFELGSLTKLNNLILGNNNLTGHIPSWFGNFSSLTHLYLSWNSLKGSIPNELGQLLSLDFLAVGDNILSEITYAELVKATNEFSSTNLIGMGSYGYVYRGIIDRVETTVAIKILKLQQPRSSRSFMAECKALRSIKHRNIVKLLTVCSSIDFDGNDFKALVFEYMPNGSLDMWLHPNENENHPLRNLNLIQRINVAIDVACALDYLHRHCQEPIVHCDLKPSNVLLDDDMVAHVSDFGLARILSEDVVSHSQTQSSSLFMRGSIGYVAPEYGTGGNASIHGDMYSYGILLLEMFIGKKPTDEMFKDNLSLSQFVKMALPDRVMEIIDDRLLSEEVEIDRNCGDYNNTRQSIQMCLVSLLRIGLSCSVESPKERMEMKGVLKEMHEVRDIYLGVG